MSSNNSSDEGRQAAPSSPALLHELTPHQVAGMIRGLDSRIADINYETRAGVPVLVYRFDVAGRTEAFALAAVPGRITSIADLYPEAAECERELQRRFGLQFSPSTESAQEEPRIEQESRMPEIRSQTVSGHITVVQEQRFRLLSDAGQGMLFTLAHNANVREAELRRFQEHGTHVVVEYTGEPNLVSGAVYGVRALEV